MTTFEYRPSIDGLRAVAVLAVLLFHLDKKWLPGGFVGVDIFFVISGYLITSIIFLECKQQRFSLAEFYQRRVARIFPALYVVLFATIIIASWIYSDQDFASAGANMFATALSIANFKLLTQGNYFTLSPDAQPFLHTWSLSVEEQFYLIFPPFLFVLYRYFRQGRMLLGSIIVVLLLSFAACIYLTSLNPTWAFYLLPTRAWELLAGCTLAAIAERSNRPLMPKVNDILTNIGIMVIGVTLLFIKDGNTFPGVWAALPVLGAVLVIGVNKGADSFTEKVLSLFPFVFIGKISYSLYLWHWPVFSFVDYGLYQVDSLTRLVLKIALTFAISIMCYFLIEQPARRYLNVPKRRLVAFSAAGLVAILFIISGLSIRNGNYLNASIDSIKTGGIAVNQASTKGSIVLMGDSNGSMYGKTMKEIAKQLDFKLNIISVAAGDPFPNSQLWRDSLTTIKEIRPNFLIFAASWNSKLENDESKLTQALAELDVYCDSIILITQPPVLPTNASRASIRQNGLTVFKEDPAVQRERNHANQIVKAQQSKKVIVIDIEPLFEEPSGEIKFLSQAGQQLYQDAGHLSEYGSELVHSMILQTIRERVRQDIVSVTLGNNDSPLTAQ